MSHAPVTSDFPLLRRAALALAFALAVAASSAFVLLVHPFLAVHEPVPADTMVVEGWLPPYALERAAAEAVQQHYKTVLVSGMRTERGDYKDALRTAQYLVAAGVDPAIVIVAPTDFARWNRTSSMALAVRERLRALSVRPNGVNVVTLGVHARQSLLAYRRMLGGSTAVGTLMVPKAEYDPRIWWRTSAGWKKTVVHFAGWLRELLFGLRG